MGYNFTKADDLTEDHTYKTIKAIDHLIDTDI